MESDVNSLDIFFQELPMSTALFDRDLILQRCNPTWISYIDELSEVAAKPGTYFFELLPGTEEAVQQHIDRALAGEITTLDSLRLSSSDNIFYWDVSFVPWIVEEGIAGYLLVAADVTERVLAHQILERKIVDRTQKLSALYDVLAVTAQPMELSDKFNQSLERLLSAVHAQAGAIQMLGNDAEHLFLVAQQGFSPILASKFRILPVQSGLSSWIAAEQQPLVLPDIKIDPRTNELLRKSSFRAYAGVPMVAQARIIGVLSVYRQSRRPFSREDIGLLHSVADQMGTAIETARLIRENQQLLIVEERSRLARELHDAVTQSLYSLTLYAETCMRFIQADHQEKAVAYLDLVSETAQQALREMRLLLHNLRPAVLGQLGLVRAIRQRLDFVEKRVGIEVDYQVMGEIDLPPQVEEGLYQIVQECLNNALKHSAASRIDLILHQEEGKVVVTVSDNGRGFKLTKAEDSGGLGLASIRERVDVLGGTLSIETAVDEGSRIQVELNLDLIYDPSDAIEILDLL